MTTYYQSFHNSTNNTLISSELEIFTIRERIIKVLLDQSINVLIKFTTSAAKHPPHRSLRISQQQKHQQIICCALAKTYGRHS